MLQNANPEITAIDEICNIDAEQALLGALLINNDAFIHIGGLQPKHFYEPLHQRIFAAMVRYWHDGQRFDPILLKQFFDIDPALADIKDGRYLSKLVSMSAVVLHINEYSNVIIDCYQRRALTMALTDGMTLVRIPDQISCAEKAMSLCETLSAAVSDMETDLFQDDYQVTESILSSMNRNVRPYKTGYEKLDLAMDGGLYPGKSYGFAARKKVGKTILAGSISTNLNMRGVKHLFICGEMSPAEIQKRNLARLLRVKPSLFNNPGNQQTEFMRRIAEQAKISKRAMIYKNAPGLTFDELKRIVMLARMQKKITGFILDYWQLVGGKKRDRSDAAHLDEVAQWIADTCRKYDMWSITMAQINQEGNTRGGEGIRLAFDQVYVLRAPEDDAGRSIRWLEMSDTRYTAWRSVGSENNPGFYLNELGPYFSEKSDDGEEELKL